MELKERYKLIATSAFEGSVLYPRSYIQVGDIMRDRITGEAFMVETDDFVREYYGGNVWEDENLWRWQGNFPLAPEASWDV